MSDSYDSSYTDSGYSETDQYEYTDQTDTSYTNSSYISHTDGDTTELDESIGNLDFKQYAKSNHNDQYVDNTNGERMLLNSDNSPLYQFSIDWNVRQPSTIDTTVSSSDLHDIKNIQLSAVLLTQDGIVLDTLHLEQSTLYKGAIRIDGDGIDDEDTIEPKNIKINFNQLPREVFYISLLLTS